MLPRLVAILLVSTLPVSALLVSGGPVSAAEWWPYDNVRFGYAIELPAEFGLAARPDNNDGLTLSPADKSARLLVFGTHMFDGDFAAEAKIRMSLAKGEGWQISYSKTTSRGMSFSGIRQDRIVYVRGVALCNGGAAFFQMDYPKAAMQRYDAVVMRLVRSLHPTEKCTSSTEQRTKGFPATG
jgi:hypothetical protein